LLEKRPSINLAGFKDKSAFKTTEAQRKEEDTEKN
jgi:hypothetical protein